MDHKNKECCNEKGRYRVQEVGGGEGVRQAGGSESTKFLISFQKCALINSFACHRLDPESPREINAGNSNGKKRSRRKKTQR